MKDKEKVESLIEKGMQVLQTDRPNAPGVIGFPTLDSKAFSAWQTQCLNFLETRLPASSPYTRTFKEKVQKGFTGSVKSGIGILESVKEDLETSEIQSDKVVETPVDKIRTICDRFHLVCRQIRDRHDSRPTIDVRDEYDVQDVFHVLLHLGFDDIRPEEWTPSYAGTSSRMDFLLKQEQIVVEIKKTRRGLGAKELGSQLIEDIARYKAHQDCSILVCFVYDPDGLINNPRGIENDLNRKGGDFPVEVLIRP
jgi:hypothetical protein